MLPTSSTLNDPGASDFLAAASTWPVLPAELWDHLHNIVQEQLQLLDSEVRNQLPQVRIDGGSTHGKAFPLFSYRRYSLPDSEIDPVVAGMTFVPADASVAIDADISGEMTGDCLSSDSYTATATSWDDLLTATRELSRKLCHSPETIVKALRDESRRVE